MTDTKKRGGSDSLHDLVRQDEMFIFKVRDYTTKIIGRRYKGESEWIYYAERGDGTRWEYKEYRVEWAKKLIGSNVTHELRENGE